LPANIHDDRAFLFTLTNNAGLAPAKCKITSHPEEGIYGAPGYLPSFGGSWDMRIMADCCKEATSMTKWGSKAFPLPPGARGPEFLVGDEGSQYGCMFFKVKALEVFAVRHG
jgi:hypothetical protein